MPVTLSTRCSNCAVKWAFSNGRCRDCLRTTSQVSATPVTSPLPATLLATTPSKLEAAYAAAPPVKVAAPVPPKVVVEPSAQSRPKIVPAVAAGEVESVLDSDNDSSLERTVDLLGGVDSNLVETQNVRRYKIAYITEGNRTNPCVVVPPGGGATKEENLFWARELAVIGPFFVVMYDVRGTGASEPSDRWAAAFQGTTPVCEMERVVGMQPKVTATTTKEDAAHDDQRRAGGLRMHASKHQPSPLEPAIAHALHDFDGYVHDAIAVLDQLCIKRAHFVGLSQGGALARLAATLHPERVLTVVSCASAASKLGLMMAAFSAGAEDFYDQLKAAQLYDEDGKPPWGGRRAGRDEYIAWRSKLFEIILPEFEHCVYEEMAGRSWDAGYMDEADCAIAALAYETWCAQHLAINILLSSARQLLIAQSSHSQRSPPNALMGHMCLMCNRMAAAGSAKARTSVIWKRSETTRRFRSCSCMAREILLSTSARARSSSRFVATV